MKNKKLLNILLGGILSCAFVNYSVADPFGSKGQRIYMGKSSNKQLTSSNKEQNTTKNNNATYANSSSNSKQKATSTTAAVASEIIQQTFALHCCLIKDSCRTAQISFACE